MMNKLLDNLRKINEDGLFETTDCSDLIISVLVVLNRVTLTED